MTANKIKITKTKVDALQPSDKDVVYWDVDLKGFCVKVTPKGRKVYYAYYRVAGQQRRPSLGVHGQVTAAQAREQAQQILAAASRGEDYSQNKQENRQSMTFKQYAAIYMSDEAPKTKRESTIQTDRLNLENHLLPALGTKKLNMISKADVSRLHSAMKNIPGAANRTFALLSHMMTVAERLGYRSDNTNPCSHLVKYKLKKHERYLSDEELKAVAEALKESEVYRLEMQSVIDAIRLLIFTGCRMREVTTLRWADVDLVNGRLKLQTSKTGAKDVYLSVPAQEVLTSIQRVRDNPYVFVGKKQGAHLVNLRKPWLRICARATVFLLMADTEAGPEIAQLCGESGVSPTLDEVGELYSSLGVDLPVGLTGVRIHDLRHSFASVAVSHGVPLAMIGKLLGHASTSMTEKYAHLANDPLREANEVLGRKLKEMMGITGKKSDEMF
ncbi:tyrosine-type recombinase/integrase [Terasakiella pusilla]|uniref:tyrosine-type recombinase/integrase n=1 Tax=Terasakiella pusilla TaxID=64973 RepID=UPI003AA9A23A